jgi:GNAT superfamily N-acetyltransferase
MSAGNVIEYRILTKRDVDQWQRNHAGSDGAQSEEPTDGIPRSGLQRGAAWMSRIAYSQDLEADTARTIAAFDDDRMVGRLHVVYTDLLIEGRRLQRCAVGEDFFVLDEYRDRAVGLSILLKALKLGLPFIESGVSGQMRKILDSWKQFVLVDASPMFQVALDRPGLVQIAKWDLYEQQPSGGFWADGLTKLSLLLRGWRQRRGLSNAGRGMLKILPARDAAAAFDRGLMTARAAVQLPWNRELLKSALAGSDPNRRAWLVECADDRSGPWLVTLYRQERILGQNPDGTTKSVREAHLNEIYPPLDERAPIGALLAFAVDRATEMGANVVQVHAMTPAIERFCRSHGLRSRMTKSIYIAADGVDPATRRLLSDPTSWWCRAFNENQFEEIFVGKQIHGHEFTPLV